MSCDFAAALATPTSLSMLEAQGDALEAALWTAVRSLEERSLLLNKLAEHAIARAGGDGCTVSRPFPGALDHDDADPARPGGAGRAR